MTTRKSYLAMMGTAAALLTLNAMAWAGGGALSVSGTVTSIDPANGILVVTEMGPWTIEKGETVMTRRTFMLTARTEFARVSRSDSPAPTGWSGDFVEAPAGWRRAVGARHAGELGASRQHERPACHHGFALFDGPGSHLGDHEDPVRGVDGRSGARYRERAGAGPSHRGQGEKRRRRPHHRQIRFPCRHGSMASLFSVRTSSLFNRRAIGGLARSRGK